MFRIIYGTIKVIFEKQPINEIGLRLVCLAFNYAALMTLHHLALDPAFYSVSDSSSGRLGKRLLPTGRNAETTEHIIIHT